MPPVRLKPATLQKSSPALYNCSCQTLNMIVQLSSEVNDYISSEVNDYSLPKCNINSQWLIKRGFGGFA